ncbi:hypothetical protein MTO96_025697 [Rhipicephalus appendiculatus]
MKRAGGQSQRLSKTKGGSRDQQNKKEHGVGELGSKARAPLSADLNSHAARWPGSSGTCWHIVPANARRRHFYERLDEGEQETRCRVRYRNHRRGGQGAACGSPAGARSHDLGHVTSRPRTTSSGSDAIRIN